MILHSRTCAANPFTSRTISNSSLCLRFIAIITIFHLISATISLMNNKLLQLCNKVYGIRYIKQFLHFGFSEFFHFYCCDSRWITSCKWIRNSCAAYICKSLRWPLNCIVCRMKCAINFNFHIIYIDSVRVVCLNNKNNIHLACAQVFFAAYAGTTGLYIPYNKYCNS